MAKRWWIAAVASALVLVSAPAAAQADDGWQDQVHLRPESVDALLTVDQGATSRRARPGRRPREIDTGVFRTVTVAHDAGGGARTSELCA